MNWRGSEAWKRLARYLARESTPAEAAAVEAAAASDPYAQRRLREAQFVWEATGRASEHADLARAFAQVDARIQQRTSGDRGPNLHLLRAGDLQAGDAPARAPGPRTPTRAQAPRGRRLQHVLVAGVFVALLAWGAAGHLAPPEADAPEPAVFTTERGQRATVALPDGSEVVLNAASEIRFTAFRAGAPREVHLRGEAFFTIAPDPARPFIIRAGEAVTEVLGTSFSVSAYTEAVSVAVAEGEVALRPAAVPADTVVLRARDLGVVGEGRLLRTERGVALDRYHAWQQGRLVFEETPLRDVAAALERQYDVDVRVADARLGERRLTAQFEEEPLYEVLRIIANTLGIRYHTDGGRVAFLPTT